MKIAKLATRVLIGGLFVGHGTQKLQGWFGGPGIEGTAGMMESLDMHPPRRNAYAAALSETVGGGLLAAGLATPLAAAMLTGTMVTAIQKVHASNGPWVAGGGWEYNAVLIAAVLALAEDGPGNASLDHAFGIEKSGLGWTAAAAALGLGASLAAQQAGAAAAPPLEVVS